MSTTQGEKRQRLARGDAAGGIKWNLRNYGRFCKKLVSHDERRVLDAEWKVRDIGWSAERERVTVGTDRSQMWRKDSAFEA